MYRGRTGPWEECGARSACLRSRTAGPGTRRGEAPKTALMALMTSMLSRIMPQHTLKKFRICNAIQFSGVRYYSIRLLHPWTSAIFSPDQTGQSPPNPVSGYKLRPAISNAWLSYLVALRSITPHSPVACPV